MTQPLLSVQHLSIGFKRNDDMHWAVKDASFEIAAGETFVLLGESGSGKSLSALSIMQLLPRAARVSEQSVIHWQGEDVLQASEQRMQALRGKDIALIFQEPMTALNPVLTVGQQLAEVIQLHEPDVSDVMTRIQNLLTSVGLSEAERRCQQYPHQLSGGMKQRVMIAMALACKPKLLIADEPTTALDVTIQAQILALLQSLQKQFNMTVLLITHDFGVARMMADHVGVMKHGELVEVATAETFFAAPKHEYSQALLKAVPRLQDAHRQTTSQEGAETLLTVDQLKVHYPIRQGILQRQTASVKAVDDVSLTLAAGKTLALVGESGCGKSTFAKALVRLVNATAGESTLAGVHLLTARGRQLRELRQDIQMIFQDPFSSMNPRLMIKDILLEGARALKVSNKKNLLDTCKQLLERIGLDASALHRYPHEFSGGQRQRICIARTLLLQPKLVICDEPTSALDVSVQATILQLLRELQSELKMAYLFITHNIAILPQLADDVAVMYLGRIVEKGPAKQLMEAPRHPYTQALLAAVPTVDHTSVPKMLEGEQPSPVTPPSGCHFHPRCPMAMPKCKVHYPGRTELDSDHHVRCFLYGGS